MPEGTRSSSLRHQRNWVAAAARPLCVSVLWLWELGSLAAYIGFILGLCRAYVGIMEKKMEATVFQQGIYWGYIGIIAKKMEATTFSSDV